VIRKEDLFDRFSNLLPIENSEVRNLLEIAVNSTWKLFEDHGAEACIAEAENFEAKARAALAAGTINGSLAETRISMAKAVQEVFREHSRNLN
jgi:hypothetical protein